ncbi:MAG TPA: DUF2971 domain-containing protein [Rugosibacter sp.]|nr:DUF2971 domain-containing protein [Rugosibacter sp.]HQN45529.1 DUF2971 domain-containing protein [Rugosibacter sp.]
MPRNDPMLTPVNYLKRYTDLPFLFDFLQTNELPLLNPESWDDKNDSHFLTHYAKSNGFASIYALCLTESPETYHHWKVFTSGVNGVCIEFNKEKLLTHVNKVPNIRAEPVVYKTINELKELKPSQVQLPFLKRIAFSDELEFRLFVATNNRQEPLMRFRLPAVAVKKIVLSPWIPKSVADQVKETIREIDGWKNISISRSSLVDNEKWKTLGCQALARLQKS